MDNKIALLVITTAIFVSLAGTFVTLNKISQVNYIRPTGYATTAQGEGIIEIEATQSIVINATNNTIDFGTCSGDTQNSAPYNLTSNATGTDANAGSWNNCSTQLPNFPAFIEVINDGNMDINLTVTSSHAANNFVGGSAPMFGFITYNETGTGGDGGCNTRKDGSPSTESVVHDWTQFVAISNHQACNNFTYNTEFRTTLRLYLFAQIPSDPSPGVKTATLTFTANPFT